MRGSVLLTNINCTVNCIYQRDGKCTYNIVSMSQISSKSECAYFIPYNSLNNNF